MSPILESGAAIEDVMETQIQTLAGVEDDIMEQLGPNCILAVCCPPGSLSQETSLYGLYINSKHVRSSDSVARDYTHWILANFDLAPKGSLQLFKDTIARLAREGYTKST